MINNEVRVLREMAETEYEESKALIVAGWEKAGNYHLKKSNALKEACLELEREQNGVKCIGCGSDAKLKVCCNSCYQELKVKAEKLDRLEKWLEREIEVSTEVTENRCKEIITKAISRKRLDTLKEVREVLQNEKQ